MTENEGVNTQVGDSPGPLGEQSGPPGFTLLGLTLQGLKLWLVTAKKVVVFWLWLHG